VANIKSALKRIQITERNRLQNKTYKSAIKTLMKKTLQSADVYANDPNEDNLALVNTNLSAAFSKIDKAVKCKVIHQNNGARKKARLAQAIRKASPAS
jgi:small subunit ribosomal protein S20